MRFTVVSCETYPNGGAASNRHLAYLEALARHGHQVELIPIGQSDGHVSAKISVNSLKVITESRAKFHLQALIRLFGVMWSTRSHREPHAVLYLATSGFLAIPVLLTRWWSRAVVFHERTELPELMVGRGVLSRADFAIYKWLFSLFDGIFVITHALKGAVSAYPGVKSNRVQVLNMIVDIDRFSGARYSSESLRKIVFCGDLSSDKDGVEMLLRAFRKFAEDRPEVELSLAGSIDNPYYRSTLRPLVEANRPGTVNVIGQVKRDLVPSLLASADLLVLARPDNEQAKYGFPTKLGEYLATGKPVLVTKTGEISRFLVDKVSAYICQADMESFFARLEEIYYAYGDAAVVGSRGREVAEVSFSAANAARQIETAVRAAMNGEMESAQ